MLDYECHLSRRLQEKCAGDEAAAQGALPGSTAVAISVTVMLGVTAVSDRVFGILVRILLPIDQPPGLLFPQNAEVKATMESVPVIF
jgi:hypothetical protein